MHLITERFEGTSGFVTLLIGKYDLLKKTVEYLNCGHGNILIFNQNLDIDTKAASLPPIGIVSSGELNWSCEYINLEDKKMFVFTDGILEAKVKGTNNEIGLAGIISLIKLIGNLAPKEGISKIKTLFLENKLETSDDATMLILGNFSSNRH
jgi:serine phosphatase RsbU (regulator of sigma subunit)